MNNRELIDILSRLDPEAEILIADWETSDYAENPNGIYNDLSERIDNEGTFEIKAREIDGRPFIEIGGIDAFV